MPLTRGQMITFLHRYDQLGKQETPTVTTATPPPPAACQSDVLCPTDQYSFDRHSTTYYVFEFETLVACNSLYVEVQLLDADNRRIGDWSNEFASDISAGAKIVIEVDSDVAWTYYEWEYSCR